MQSDCDKLLKEKKKFCMKGEKKPHSPMKDECRNSQKYSFSMEKVTQSHSLMNAEIHKIIDVGRNQG